MKILAPFPSLCLAALCAGATPTWAQTGDALSLTHVAPASLRLHLAHSAPLSGRVQVVRLRTGQPLFTEHYAAAAYGHRFDFNQAPNGRYLVWLQSGATLYRCLVRVHTRAHTSAIHVCKLTSRVMPSTVVTQNIPGDSASASSN